MGKLRVYCLKTLKKLSIYSLGNTPSAPSEFGIGQATVRVHGQTGNRTNTGRAITPFMFNEEEYHVSVPFWFRRRILNIS